MSKRYAGWGPSLQAWHRGDRWTANPKARGDAAGKPVTNLPELIKVAVTDPALGQYLLDALNQDDAAWEKLERTAMNYGVMPKP